VQRAAGVAGAGIRSRPKPHWRGHPRQPLGAVRGERHRGGLAFASVTSGPGARGAVASRVGPQWYGRRASGPRPGVGSGAFSTAIVLLFWNGRMQMLTEQGPMAVLINVAILVALLVLKWPSTKF
jgi:hypothetical protein